MVTESRKILLQSKETGGTNVYPMFWEILICKEIKRYDIEFPYSHNDGCLLLGEKTQFQQKNQKIKKKIQF